MKKVIALLVVVLFVSCSEKNKVGYINIQKVFSDFTYKKELEKELESVKNGRKFILDSMETNLKILNKRLREEKDNKNLVAEFQTLREIFLEKRERFEEEEVDMVKRYDEKIINQLNSYVKEFGSREGYSMILGANSTGNVMYADTALDLSGPVVKFINEKYKGKH